MGIFDRFKSKKEKELSAKGVPIAVDSASTAKTKKPAAKEKKPSKPQAMRTLPKESVGIILEPLVTEKAAVLASHGQYSFRVSPDANRTEVRKAMKAMYGVLPVAVNIQRVRGKFVRFGKMNGRRAFWKKAIVTLPAGKTIDVYEGV